MNKDCIIQLIHKNNSTETNSIGEPVVDDDYKSVYGVKKSVRQSEFFQAFASGFKPEIVIEVNSFEYNNEELCELEGQRFRIYRSYPLKNSEKTELYLTQLVGETDVTS